jgi:hypothetical protein
MRSLVITHSGDKCVVVRCRRPDLLLLPTFNKESTIDCISIADALTGIPLYRSFLNALAGMAAADSKFVGVRRRII